jgi:acetyl/propionyl-CoA carboxylase alpha subunit
VAEARYEVTIGERTVRVAIRRAADGVFARIDDGEEQRVALDTLHGALRSLSAGDGRVELLANRLDDGAFGLVLGGLDYRADVVDEAHARLAAVAGGRQTSHARTELKAPMPGLVVRMLSKEGDEVQAGQPLAVLQAMKMENELSLPRGGKVTAVHVSDGQTVDQGQLLLTLE